MPTEDRPSRGHERCERHPANPVVARCDGCGRPLCLVCATPVRGEAYGTECLAAVLGHDAPEAAEPHVRTREEIARIVSRVAFGLAVLSTALPWSRFGPGSDVFGAWSRSAGWSLVVAIAAIAGLLVSLAQGRTRLLGPRTVTFSATLGAVVVIGSLLALLFPPAFSRPWLGPWAAVAAGAVACAASILAGRVLAEAKTAGI